MDKKFILERIDKLLAEYSEMRKQSKYDDLSDFQKGGSLDKFITRALATVHAIAEPSSAYVKQSTNCTSIGMIPKLVGILQALKADIEAGYLWHLNELIHADIFTDFLEMAKYLLEEGYKDPAAVLIGGVLEEHLRKLCLKNGIQVEIQRSGRTEFKQASLMNDELKGSNVYANLEHKHIIAWLDLRNKAAHGRYTEYNKTQAENMLSGVRDFITRFVAYNNFPPPDIV